MHYACYDRLFNFTLSRNVKFRNKNLFRTINVKYELVSYSFIFKFEIAGVCVLFPLSSPVPSSTAVSVLQHGFHNNLILYEICAEMNKEVRLTPTDSVYTVKPLELRKYVQKFVEIVTIDGERLLGTVYTIDPVSER